MSISDFELLALLPRAPEKRSTSDLLARLSAAGVSMTPRSLQRRLITLSTTHPLVCDDRSKPYGWAIKSDAPPTLGEMSVQEAIALKLAERYLREAIPADVLEDLKHYFSQANTKLKGESLYRAWLDKIRLVPATQPLISPVASRQVLANAYAGVLRGLVLNVTYLSRDEDKPKTYDIEPRAIVVRGHMTYLVAQFPWSDEPSLMALHRFKAVRLTDNPVRAEPVFDLDRFISAGGMGFMPSEPQQVQLRFYDAAAAHLLETPIAADQTLTGDPFGVSELVVRLPVTEQFKWWVLGFGERVEVISPASLRAEIKKRVTGAAAHYAKRAKK